MDSSPSNSRNSMGLKHHKMDLKLQDELHPNNFININNNHSILFTNIHQLKQKKFRIGSKPQLNHTHNFNHEITSTKNKNLDLSISPYQIRSQTLANQSQTNQISRLKLLGLLSTNFNNIHSTLSMILSQKNQI